MAAFVAHTATPALRHFARGLRADFSRHPEALALVVAFGMVCLHATL